MDAAPQPISRDRWRFADDGCSARFSTDAGVGIYEVVYQAKGSPVAGLGLAAIRDFASYLRYGADGATLRETPGALQRTIGYGYSQSGRFLREFVRDGFNADERGRPAFDALMISSAGAGGGSFNHRFAMPGVAGNSVLSVLRPVDLPPFTDEGLLAQARAARVMPKIFYTFSSTDMGARGIPHAYDERRPAGRAAGDDVAPLFPGGDTAFLRAAGVGQGPSWVAIPALHELRPAALGFARAPPRSRRVGRQQERAAVFPVSIRREGRAGCAQRRQFSKGAVISVRHIHAASVADGLRTGIHHDEGHHDRAAAN